MPTSLAPFPLPTRSTRNRVELADFVTPHYEVDHAGKGLRLTVFVPGTAASGVEVTLKGPDLILTARKEHPLRINFRAAHLEAVQHDYRLVLRVGHGFDLSRLSAALESGVLTLDLPRASGVNSRSEPGLKVA